VTTPAQEKLADCVIIVAGSGLKSAKKEKGLNIVYKQTAMHQPVQLTFNKFGTGLTFL
jgi:hypothetical protein